MCRIAILFFALVLPAAVSAQAPTPADTRRAIDAANAAVVRLTTAGHSDSLAEFYHTNATVYPPNMTSLSGKAAIRDFFAGISHISTPPPVLTLRADSVWNAGTWALELGRWTWTYPAGAKIPAGEAQADSGKYMARWVQEKGKWVIMQDTWSSDVMMRPQQKN